jgi:hypothetical protein
LQGHMGRASYLPGELIPKPLSGSIPELPHVAKLPLMRIANHDSVGGDGICGSSA